MSAIFRERERNRRDRQFLQHVAFLAGTLLVLNATRLLGSSESPISVVPIEQTVAPPKPDPAIDSVPAPKPLIPSGEMILRSNRPFYDFRTRVTMDGGNVTTQRYEQAVRGTVVATKYPTEAPPTEGDLKLRPIPEDNLKEIDPTKVPWLNHGQKVQWALELTVRKAGKLGETWVVLFYSKESQKLSPEPKSIEDQMVFAAQEKKGLFSNEVFIKPDPNQPDNARVLRLPSNY